MGFRMLWGIFLTVAIVVSAGVPAFSQEQTQPVVSKEASQAAAPAAIENKSGDMSLYGEVRSVDQAAGLITVQYYDYDSDEEKTAGIIVSKETKLDGVAALGDIKQNDWVDAIYTSADGKNTAKSIIVEKEEMLEPVSSEDTYVPSTEGEY